MSAPFHLREADAGDAEAIAALHARSWQRTYRGMMPDAFLDGPALEDRRRVWHERLGPASTDRLVAVAEDGTRIVGFICVFAREDDGWGAYIDNLHVAHDWQGRGVGRALMRRGAEWICETQPGAVVKSDPGGGSAPNCRYVWPDARALL